MPSESADPRLPQVFKGIALFTPGGDMVYCIDPQKQSQWHLDLCATLQDTLSLPEPPHFLLPCYTATVDRWHHPTSGELVTATEIYPRVQRYQALLNVIFGTGQLIWEPNYSQPIACSPVVLDTYQAQFPQLWDCHDLIMRIDHLRQQPAAPPSLPAVYGLIRPQEGYLLKLFVSSAETAATENTLKALHKVLDQVLDQSYTLQLVDVSKHPDQAEANQVAATPTLVRAWPLPVRRLVGNLTQQERLLAILHPGDASL